MNHPPLTSKQAMLFVFDEEDHRSFWMKNVPYDLDIAFFDSNKKIVSITTMFGTSPMMKTAVPPQHPEQLLLICPPKPRPKTLCCIKILLKL